MCNWYTVCFGLVFDVGVAIIALFEGFYFVGLVFWISWF